MLFNSDLFQGTALMEQMLESNARADQSWCRTRALITPLVELFTGVERMGRASLSLDLRRPGPKLESNAGADYASGKTSTIRGGRAQGLTRPLA